MKAVLNWSSGKDAALAFHILQQQGSPSVRYLLTTLSTENGRILMHGVREPLLDAQQQRIGLPHRKVMLDAAATDAAYREAMEEALLELKAEGITASVFGDIFLEDLRQYREQQLKTLSLEALFPLWGRDTAALVGAVEDAGIEALIVCVDEKKLGKEFLGRKVNRALLAELPAGVDPCGENGEYHSFVYNAPFFRAPIDFTPGAVAFRDYPTAGGGYRAGFYYQDLIPA